MVLKRENTETKIMVDLESQGMLLQEGVKFLVDDSTMARKINREPVEINPRINFKGIFRFYLHLARWAPTIYE